MAYLYNKQQTGSEQSIRGAVWSNERYVLARSKTRIVNSIIYRPYVRVLWFSYPDAQVRHFAMAQSPGQGVVTNVRTQFRI